MPTAKQYRAEIGRLIKTGPSLIKATQEDLREVNTTEPDTSFYISYPLWYSEAYEVVKHLLPDRLAEFISLYLPDPKRKNISGDNFTIQDWLLGKRSPTYSMTGKKVFADDTVVTMKLMAQIQILQSCLLRFDSILLNIKRLTLADVFDSELAGAEELLRAGFLRPAGVVAGVVLEKHLKEVCGTNKLRIRKKNPCLANFNDALKDADIFDIPQWRFVQRLSDIRNLCGHEKGREPTKEEIKELINGVEKTLKTAF
ncbi:hypothetical protein L6273_00630 [Candidatus Parcubacteria bacterium]|nr:hypothetical protein [Candidatus Parcubacteria bacterium]